MRRHLFLLTIFTAALLLAAAPAQAQLWLTYGEAAEVGGEPPARPRLPPPPAAGRRGGAPAQAQLWLTYGEAAEFGGEPAVRFQIYHQHGTVLAWCVGYLYFTPTQDRK